MTNDNNQNDKITKHKKVMISEKALASLGVTIISIIALLIITLTCSTRIKPGEVGVVVDLIGSKRGVENKELTVGFYFIPPWKSVYKFPIYEQNHQWVGQEGFSFQTSEGLSVNADIGITFNLEPNRIHELFSKYRRGMEEITHLFIRNSIRDSINRVASKMKIEDLIGSKKEEFFDLVLANVTQELKSIGFNISHIFVIGKFEVPDLVMQALNKKIEATQRAQQRENELRESEAQARKEMALAEGIGKSKIISAKAEAESLIIAATSKANALSGEGAGFLIDLKK